MFEGRKKIDELERALWGMKSVIAKIEKELSENKALCLTKQMEMVKDISGLTDKILLAQRPSSDLLEKIESLERRFASLHGILIEKSPTTGKERLTKTGRIARNFYEPRT